jgi:hypothetical protein
VDDRFLGMGRRDRRGEAELAPEFDYLEGAAVGLIGAAKEPERHGRPGVQVHSHLACDQGTVWRPRAVAFEPPCRLAQRLLKPTSMVERAGE